MMDDLSNIENFGIDLKLESEHMEEFYCETLRQWFMDPKGYVTISITDREFELEKDGELIGVVYIFDSISLPRCSNFYRFRRVSFIFVLE